MLDKRDIYLRNVVRDYKEIYGNKGIKFLQKSQMSPKKEHKKTCKVRFSNEIEYSRN